VHYDENPLVYLNGRRVWAGGWSTFFGNGPRAPFRERPGILRVQFSPEGRIAPKLPAGPSE